MASEEAPAVDVSEQELRISASIRAATTIQHRRLARPLSVNFRAAQQAYLEVESSTLPGNDEGLQKRIGEGLALCEASLVQVDSEAIFSSNELGEDINTDDLKYLLLPFYRGELLLRVCDQSKRREALREALKTLRGFLADQDRLELLTPESKNWREMGASASSDPASVRTNKIARMKASKAAKQRMEELASQQEAEMLEKIETVRRADGTLPPIPTPEEEDPNMGLQFLSLLPKPGEGGPLGATPTGPIGPLGLRTVDPWKDPKSRLSYATAMHQIHTGEIPGLYTFTVEEGLRMEEAERAMAEAQKMTEMGEREEARAQAKRDKEEGNDEEDEEERLKLIKQDEFREMNKRGWGNRKNRS